MLQQDRPRDLATGGSAVLVAVVDVVAVVQGQPGDPADEQRTDEPQHDHGHSAAPPGCEPSPSPSSSPSPTPSCPSSWFGLGRWSGSVSDVGVQADLCHQQVLDSGSTHAWSTPVVVGDHQCQRLTGSVQRLLRLLSDLQAVVVVADLDQLQRRRRPARVLLVQMPARPWTAPDAVRSASVGVGERSGWRGGPGDGRATTATYTSPSTSKLLTGVWFGLRVVDRSCTKLLSSSSENEPVEVTSASPVDAVDRDMVTGRLLLPVGRQL